MTRVAAAPKPAIPSPGDWFDRPDRNCAGEDTELFFPEGHDPQQVAAVVKAAKRICAGCPVKQDCLEYALSLPPFADHGIWGGTSAKWRAWVRRRRGQQVAG